MKPFISSAWVAVVISFNVVACGTYRPTGAEFRGFGAFKAPSDYKSPRSTASSPSSPRLRWPVTQIRVNRGFGDGQSTGKHDGLDLGGTRGTPIVAAHSGVVVYAGNGFSGYGNMVLIEYNHEWATLYAHLNRIQAHEGQRVGEGQQLGTMGATGHATGVHLHFEVLHHHIPINPLPLLDEPRQHLAKQ